MGARAPVAMARSHQETHHIARSLRKKLLSVGVLSGPEYSIPSVTPMGSPYRLSLAAGDWIRFQVKDNDLGVFNGTTGRLVEIRQRVGEKLDLKVALDDNPSNVISFPSTQICDGSGQIQLSHGYATTIYSAQGATFDEVLLLRSRRMTFREFYVALTRARQRFTVFEANRSRLDAFKRNGSKDDLVAHLANELSATKHRDVPKALALDFPLNEVSVQPVQAEGERQGEWLWSIFNADAISQSPNSSLTWLDTPNRPHKRQKRTRVG